MPQNVRHQVGMSSVQQRIDIEHCPGNQRPTRDRSEIRAWADSKGIVPVNIEPNRVDAESASMSLLHKMTAEETAFVKEMTWEDFFVRFDLLKLTLVYDDSTVSNEILRMDDKIEPPQAYRTVIAHH